MLIQGKQSNYQGPKAMQFYESTIEMVERTRFPRKSESADKLFNAINGSSSD
jgi:hypothetical protein